MQGGQAGADRAPGLRLAELLATRLVHDLSGPTSGLCAALAEPRADAEALEIAREAAATLRRRLALYRAAWGAPAPLDAGGLREMAAALPNAHRLRIVFAGPVEAAALAPPAARLLLNLLLLAAESLPRGGTVTLEGDPAQDMVLAIDGARAGWPEGFAAMLTDAACAWAALPDAPRGPRLQAALTALLAHQSGGRLRLLLAGDAEAAAPVLVELPASAA